MKPLNSLKKKLYRRLATLALAGAVLQPACGVFGSPGPSNVAQGKRYSSGDASFDELFAAVHELQLKLVEAPDQEQSARVALAERLDLEFGEEAVAAAPAPTAESAAAGPKGAGPDALSTYGESLGQSAIGAIPGAAAIQSAKRSADQIGSTLHALGNATNAAGSTAPAAAAAPVKKRRIAPSASLIAKSLKQRQESLGVGLRLEVDRDALESGEAKLTVHVVGEETSDAKQLARALESTAKDELKLALAMRKARMSAEKLKVLSAAFDANVDVAFRKGGPGKKAEVRKNLQDAGAMMKVVAERADAMEKRALGVVEELERVASAKAPEAPVANAAPAEHAPKKAAKKPEAAPEAAASTKKAPAKKAKPAPRPAPDFEP